MMDAHVRLYQAQHPGDPRVVMTAYRQYILARKRQWGSARGLIYYQGFIDSYLLAKRMLTPCGSRKPES